LVGWPICQISAASVNLSRPDHRSHSINSPTIGRGLHACIAHVAARLLEAAPWILHTLLLPPTTARACCFPRRVMQSPRFAFRFETPSIAMACPSCVKLCGLSALASLRLGRGALPPPLGLLPASTATHRSPALAVARSAGLGNKNQAATHTGTPTTQSPFDPLPRTTQAGAGVDSSSSSSRRQARTQFNQGSKRATRSSHTPHPLLRRRVRASSSKQQHAVCSSSRSSSHGGGRRSRHYWGHRGLCLRASLSNQAAPTILVVVDGGGVGGECVRACS
jgi:hypothetical protein